MKFYWFKKIYGWGMTGLVGKDAKWFVGYSKALFESKPEEAIHSLKHQTKTL